MRRATNIIMIIYDKQLCKCIPSFYHVVRLGKNIVSLIIRNNHLVRLYELLEFNISV